MLKDKSFLEHFDSVIELGDKQSEKITGGRIYDRNIPDDRGNIWGVILMEHVPCCNFYHNAYCIIEINKALTDASKSGAAIFGLSEEQTYETMLRDSKICQRYKSWVEKVCSDPKYRSC